MKRNNILVECYNDERLFFAFNISKYNIEHNSNGKSEVLDKIMNRENTLAVIDNDKRTKHKYFDKAVLQEAISDDIKIYYESEKKNFILVFFPRLEDVIIRIVNNNKKNIKTAEKLKLTISYKGLHNIGSDKNKLKKLKDLYIALINRCSEIKAIKKYL